jgi:hypothetical protein
VVRQPRVVLIQSPQVVMQHHVQRLQWWYGYYGCHLQFVLTSGTQNPTVCPECNHKHSLYIWRKCDRSISESVLPALSSSIVGHGYNKLVRQPLVVLIQSLQVVIQHHVRGYNQIGTVTMNAASTIVLTVEHKINSLSEVQSQTQFIHLEEVRQGYQ